MQSGGHGQDHDRNTGRPRGFAADGRFAEDALRDMHGRELYGRDISVNRADPKMATEEPDHGYGGSRGARDSYRTETRSDECFKSSVAGLEIVLPRNLVLVLNTEKTVSMTIPMGPVLAIESVWIGSRDRYGARDRYPAIDDRFEDDRFGGRNAHSG